MLRQTSIQAYYGLDLNQQEEMIIETLSHIGEGCISEIADYMGWERSTVSGRMNDLKKVGILIYVGKRKSKITGITSDIYRLKNLKETLF